MLIILGRAAKAEAEGNALIPLGKGQTLNVPMRPDLATPPAPSRRHYKAAKMAANKTAKPALSALLIARL